MKNIENLLKDMTTYFLKTLFDNIPVPNVYIEPDMEKDTLGTFSLEQNTNYLKENDELLGKYEYRSHYKRYGNGFGIEYNKMESYQDPLNHPDPVIKISEVCLKNIRKTTATLLHELVHYYLWYIGWDFGDEDVDFNRKCREMDIPTNYGSYDYRKIDKYIEMYCEYIENKKSFPYPKICLNHIKNNIKI